MKKHLLFLVTLILLITSCQSYKTVPYLQDAELVNQSVKQRVLYDALIAPKDLLTIVVSCTTPELAVPFNLASGTATNTQSASQQYLVDNQGCINFPILGKLRIGGMTKGEAENMIVDKLKSYLKEIPIVTVRMINYKISVIGEVTHPGTFIISNEKVNVLEALAMAGDMTVYGMRNNAKLIREDSDGRQQIITLNLNEADIVLSEHYYLQQNDILYITPNKTKARNSDIGSSTGLWVSVTSVLLSLASFMVTMMR